MHSGMEVKASVASDFLKCPHGGCTKPCEANMDCGHTCKLLCHPISHDLIKCNNLVLNLDLSDVRINVRKHVGRTAVIVL
jgi:hypothetical protein